MITRLSPGILIAAVLFSSLAYADPHEGKTLVDENCQKCHGSEYYTREDRKVDSLPALGKQVRFCEQALGLTLFDDQIESITEHLNQDYYKFQ